MVASSLLVACNTASVYDSDYPEWVQSEPDNYPHAQYLSATGSASNAEQAKARALGNLAKVFEVQINEVSVSVDDVRTHEVQGVETVEKRRNLASTVNLETSKMVQGARIAEQWQNSADLSYYALAVLNRSQAGNNIRDEMLRLDKETQYSLDQYKTRSDAIKKISDLQQVNTLQNDRQLLQKALKVIDVQGRGSPAKWTLAELREELGQALIDLPLRTRGVNDDVGELEQILQGAAARAGFDPGARNGEQSYSLVAAVDSQPPIKKNDWYWLRSSLKIELVSLDGNSVLGYRTWMLKVSAGDVSQLNGRMKKSVEEKLEDELLSSMLDFAS